MTTPRQAPQIYVSTLNDRPIIRLASDYRPASGRQMADDIVGAMRDKIPQMVHADA